MDQPPLEDLLQRNDDLDGYRAVRGSSSSRIQFAAALVRPLFGLVAMFVLPSLYPGIESHRVIFAAYTLWSLFGLVMIWRGIGGVYRIVLSGILDVLTLTFIVHCVGSVATMLVSVYYFAAVVTTLTVGRRLGLALAVLGAASYSVVVVGETLGFLPYGPDAPIWARTAPSQLEALVVISLFSILLILSAGVVGILVTRIRVHEQELVAVNRRLRELSRRDPLTRLFNRRHLMTRLEDELARARRGHPLSVIMIDLDGFKRVNDQQGHHEGDRVLTNIAAALADATREVDVPGRYGGDEFVVLLPDTPPDQARVVADRLAEAVHEVGKTVDEHEPVTASVGLAHAKTGDEARALIQRADRLAYQAKRDGGNGVRAEEPPAEWDESVETGVRPKKTDKKKRKKQSG